MTIDDPENLSPVVLDHARYPRNLGPLDSFNGHAVLTGPCGDTMEFWLLILEGRVYKAAFATDGCESSLACGSMATCLAKGKKLEDAYDISQRDILEALSGLPAEWEHCSLLAASVVREACDDYLAGGSKTSRTGADSNQQSCDSCGKSECSAFKPKPGESDEEFKDRQRLQSRLCRIRHKIIVLSGKGGVGKSTIAANLAIALVMAGKRVGLLDIDIHGPSIPTMLGIEDETVPTRNKEMIPIMMGGLKVISIGFFLSSPDDAVIWRGPMKYKAIQQFLKDVDWGDLDFLIIDSPPGTGDEPLTLCQLISDLDGAVIVTTPQKVAAMDVRKSITFCRVLNVPVLGVIENMSGFACPKCGAITQILRSGGGKRISEDMHVPFLGSIPIDPQIAEACDSGQVFFEKYKSSATANSLNELIKPILALDKTRDSSSPLPYGIPGG